MWLEPTWEMLSQDIILNYLLEILNWAHGKIPEEFQLDRGFRSYLSLSDIWN